MEKGEVCNITDVSPVTNNFKTNEDRKSWRGKSGTNMSGRDRPSLISKSDLAEVETG